jgi:cell division protein FtsZ
MDDAVMGENLAIMRPMLVIGVGGAGSRIAGSACNEADSKFIVISNDINDKVERIGFILIDPKTWANPSSYKLRSYAQESSRKIRDALRGYDTLVMVANLAGRGGSAIAPVVSRLAHEEASKKTVVSIVIMPFRFEKDRVFQAAISLKRIRDSSDATIVLDNDAFIESDPAIQLDQCYKKTNKALIQTIGLVCRGDYKELGTSLLSSSDSNGGAEVATADSVAMMYHNGYPGSIKSTLLYVMGGKKVSVGLLNSIVNNLKEIFTDVGTPGVSIVVSDGDKMNVSLLASVEKTTRFDDYDPIAQVIPQENTLDWDDLDSSPDIELTIPNIE